LISETFLVRCVVGTRDTLPINHCNRRIVEL
jgi:hypothetical protein